MGVVWPTKAQEGGLAGGTVKVDKLLNTCTLADKRM